MSARPLLTFAIAGFNQEGFIREAVAAAFAQTYSPLEIILSDDCSPDRTFAIMQEMAAAYRGPHRVLLNRNDRRRSIGGHINRVVELAGGDLIVGAAGDDVSLPHRTQATYEAWEGTGRRATSIHSNIFQIDAEGHSVDQIYNVSDPVTGTAAVEQKANPVDYVQTLEPLVLGCAHAFAKRLFKVFGNLPEEVIHEDNAIALRSIIAGGLCYLPDRLVKYRVHDSNIFVKQRQRVVDLASLKRQEDRLRRDFRNRETMHAGFLKDLTRAHDLNLISSGEFQKTSQEAERGRRKFRMMGCFLEQGTFSKFRTLAGLRRAGLSDREFGLLWRRLLPGPLLLRVRQASSLAGLSFTRRSNSAV